MKYLDNYENFRGTDALNELGENLDTFLENYNPTQYPAPFNTTDIIIFKTEDKLVNSAQTLKLLMIKRKNHPNIGYWALPGGFVDLKENLEDGAARELEEETGIKGLPLMQLRTWGDYDRDPRWRVITTAYMSIIEGDIAAKAGDDAAEAEWFTANLKPESATSLESKSVDSLKAESADYDNCDNFVLTLTDEAHNVTVSAVVKVTEANTGILAERKYETISSNGIAGDHGALIVDALLYIRDRLPGRSV